MNELQVFNFKENEIRTTLINNEPYFCLKDVCKILELDQVSRVKSRLKEAGVTTSKVGVQTGFKSDGTPALQNVDMIFINESNLYKVIFQSRKEEAEQFTEYVTGTILPSIRKYGVYMTEETMQLNTDKLLIAQAKVMNAKARVASVWLKLAARVPNNQSYQQICNSYASEVLTGAKVLPLPECDERYYTATEIAEMVGSTANMVGRRAKVAGIKPADENTYSEYGKWFFDKSAHSNKEVSTFKYNTKGLDAIKALFNEIVYQA